MRGDHRHAEQSQQQHEQAHGLRAERRHRPRRWRAEQASRAGHRATADLLALEIAKRNPAKNLETKFTIRLSPGAIGVRRGDPDLLQWVNTFVYFHKLNGDFSRLFEKWAGYPLPELPVF